ncbi:MAG: TolC family protein [Deltaproteobacteria bacterium HGW-Deltaproteobacteria-6]|jgi:HAE1 family hydrophobic/amphiphilic exporter-1|nr:MAG: TolC family protein [Deltaproteobacteria bacterium HGW-Deltaproteobacteria-6]
MKKVHFLLFFIGAVLLAAPQAGAQVRVLTIEEAVAIATDSNRDLQKARENINWAKGKYIEERAAALPQVTITGLAAREKDDSQSLYAPIMAERVQKFMGDVGVTQPLFTWGQVSSAIRAAGAGFESAKEQVRFYAQAARRDTTAAFYDVLLARELHLLAKQNEEQKKRHLNEAGRKHELGTATDYDVLAADVAVRNARPEVIRTENQVHIARERLRHLLALSEEVDVAGSLDARFVPRPAYEDVVDRAQKQRPELTDLRHRINMSADLVRVANAGNKPRLDARGGYGWRSLEVLDQKSDGPAWSIGVQLSFPIFDGLRTRGRVAQATSDHRRLQIEEAKQTDTIALEARDALNAVKEAEEIVRSMSGTVTLAERLLAMSEKGYVLGVKIRLEVDDAEFNLLQAKGNLSRAKRNYLLSLTQLDWVMGVLGEKPEP